MTHIQNNKVKNISECNLIHEMVNPYKRAKQFNSHYSPILNVFMNTRPGKEKFKNFCIILDSRCSSTIVMGTLVKKLGLEKYATMQWNTQAENITTNIKVKINFTLPALRATNGVTCNFHVYDSAKGRYYMILGRYLLT